MTDNELKSRVKKFLEREHITASDFAKKNGLSAAYVNSIDKNMSFAIVEKLYKINPTISLTWLLFGAGEMYRNTAESYEALKKENADLREKVSMLQKIVTLYERNENGINNAKK